jgi:hypothetical protein
LVPMQGSAITYAMGNSSSSKGCLDKFIVPEHGAGNTTPVQKTKQG